MAKLDVTVSRTLIEEIDVLAEEFEYTDRSEFVRAVVQISLESVLTSGAWEGVLEVYTDVSAGRTISTNEARERLGIDGN